MGGINMTVIYQVVWLAILLGLIIVIPHLFNKSVEKADAYCRRRHVRLTEKGKDVIFTFYLVLYIAYLYAYMVKFL